MAATPVSALGQLLPTIDNRLNFHQSHEGPAEAAGSGITETSGNVRNAMIGFREQVTSQFKADFRDYLAMARAQAGEMALQ